MFQILAIDDALEKMQCIPDMKNESQTANDFKC